MIIFSRRSIGGGSCMQIMTFHVTPSVTLFHGFGLQENASPYLMQ